MKTSNPNAQATDVTFLAKREHCKTRLALDPAKQGRSSSKRRLLSNDAARISSI